jgi:hypothetical protein
MRSKQSERFADFVGFLRKNFKESGRERPKITVALNAEPPMMKMANHFFTV